MAAVRMERGAKRVRAYVAGTVVADTVRPWLVWEDRPYPAYYVPVADVRTELLHGTGSSRVSEQRGEGHTFDLHVLGRTVRGAAWHYPDSPEPRLRDLIRLRWEAMDAWFEEDEQVFVHPRDPHTRIDVLSSSRHVRVECNGVVLAESRQPRLLFETGLPVRFYLPLPDLRMDLMVPSETVTRCPYKGTASYWSVELGQRVERDLVWTYTTPLAEVAKIAGLAAFWNERVDLYVDGDRYGPA